MSGYRLATLLSLAFGALLVAAPSAGAPPAVPSTVSYQGVLTDTSGEPRTGSVDLTLRIYDAVTDGTLVYKESFSGVSLDRGVFAVELGPSGEATDAPEDPETTDLAEALRADLGSLGPSRFLEVTVGTEGPLARTQLLAAPYAVHAETADQAEVAQSAATATTTDAVGALDSGFVTAAFEHFPFDGAAPANDDPREGLGDSDGNGAPNFVDADNDGDELDDATELERGSDLNLVTPFIASLSPSQAIAEATLTVTVEGSGFQPGLSVEFGSETPTPSALDFGSFEVEVGPQPVGTAEVVLTQTNGETATAAFEFLSSTLEFELPFSSGDQLTFDRTDAGRSAVGGTDAYAVDTAGDEVPDSVFTFESDGPSQIAVAWDPTGRLAGARCRNVDDRCDIELAVDTDVDFDLSDESGVFIQSLTGGFDRRIFGSPSLDYDPSGNPVLGFGFRDFDSTGTGIVVAHDRDGDGSFSGANEVAPAPAGASNAPLNLGDVAVNASSHVAYVYGVRLTSEDVVRLVHDLDGDGSFEAVTESFAVESSESTLTCVGAAFDASEHLAVLAGFEDHTTLHHDLNGDGDFEDAGEATSIDLGPGPACGAESNPFTLVSSTRLLIDRDGDGDFDGADEDKTLTGGTPEAVDVAFDGAGVPLVVLSEGRLLRVP